uniref:Uncharacterized protein n=1 Tax=Anguilla anguilla TaxID=7936 RepID=A0A0E9QVY6_ANGAN
MVGKTLLPETSRPAVFRCLVGSVTVPKFWKAGPSLERFTTVQSVLHLQIMLLTVVW